MMIDWMMMKKIDTPPSGTTRMKKTVTIHGIMRQRAALPMVGQRLNKVGRTANISSWPCRNRWTDARKHAAVNPAGGPGPFRRLLTCQPIYDGKPVIARDHLIQLLAIDDVFECPR